MYWQKKEAYKSVRHTKRHVLKKEQGEAPHRALSFADLDNKLQTGEKKNPLSI